MNVEFIVDRVRVLIGARYAALGIVDRGVIERFITSGITAEQRAALDDLARHSPVHVHLDVDVPRLDPALEFTTWLVIGESVVNAQKHAHATRVAIEVHRQDCQLRVQVRDDGRGAANPDGPGLRGMRDRVEAAGGALVIDSPDGAGTTIEAVLPCAS